MKEEVKSQNKCLDEPLSTKECKELLQNWEHRVGFSSPFKENFDSTVNSIITPASSSPEAGFLKLSSEQPAEKEDHVFRLRNWTAKRDDITVRRFKKRKIFGYIFVVIFGASIFSFLLGFITIDRREQETTKKVTVDDSSTACDIGLLSPSECASQTVALEVARNAAEINLDIAKYIVTICAVFLMVFLYLGFRGQRGMNRARELHALPKKSLNVLVIPVPDIHSELSRSVFQNEESSRRKSALQESNRNKKIMKRSYMLESAIPQIKDEIYYAYIANHVVAADGYKLRRNNPGDAQWGRFDDTWRELHPSRLLEIIENPLLQCKDKSGKCFQFHRCILQSWRVFIKLYEISISAKLSTEKLSFFQIEAIIRHLQSEATERKLVQSKSWIWDNYLNEYQQARFSNKKWMKKEYEDFLNNFNQLCQLLDVLEFSERAIN